MARQYKSYEEDFKKTVVKITQFLFNPRFLFCFGIAWLITNGWSYILFGIGTYFQIENKNKEITPILSI